MEGQENQNNNAQNTTGQNNNATSVANTNQASNGAVDYDKIQAIVDGRNAKTEDSVLKAYFQKQGLSETEMQSAIESFKASKAQKLQEQNQNNLNLQNENANLKAQMQKMQIENKARDVAGELGIDAKVTPYLLKMADLSKAIDSEGKISDEAIKTAFNDVLEALPQLKSPTQQENKGFQKIGGENSDKQPNVDDVLKEIFS